MLSLALHVMLREATRPFAELSAGGLQDLTVHRERQRPFKCCHTSVNLCCSVIHSTVFHTHWLNFTGLSGDAGVYLVNWSSTAGNCYCCFSGMDSIYASVRSYTFLQSIFLACVKELWPIYCVFEHGSHPINLLFSVLYQSNLNTLRFCAVEQP